MIYLDHNATTPLSLAAKRRMADAMEHWGNPSSTHSIGRKALELLEKARSEVAIHFGALPSEVVFTSGGSEANSSVMLGSFLAQDSLRVLASPVEHSSVRETLGVVEKKGGHVETLRLTPSGDLDLAYLEERLESFRPRDYRLIVSVMAANNETGIIFPIPQVSELCDRYGVLLHCDAVQAFTKIAPKHWSGAAFVTFSAHKVNGPKGAGALVIRNGHQLVATHYGGSQEIKRRGGTQNAIGIAGFAGALTETINADELQQMERARDYFEETLRSRIPDIEIQGKDALRLPNTSNIRMVGLSAELILQALDLDQICISAGSACSSGSLKPSAVLTAMGMTPEQAKECFRVSMGRETTAVEMSHLVDRLEFHAHRIRSRRALR